MGTARFHLVDGGKESEKGKGVPCNTPVVKTLQATHLKWDWSLNFFFLQVRCNR